MSKRFKTVDVVDPAILHEAQQQYGTMTVQGHFPTLTKEFLFAGNAHFTVSSTSKHINYTFAIRAREGKGRYAGAVTYFARVRARGSSPFPYQYLGIVKKDGTLMPAGKSAFLPGSKEFDVCQWAIRAVLEHMLIDADVKIQHNGTCGRCNRATLVDNDSIASGIGPECVMDLLVTL